VDAIVVDELRKRYGNVQALEGVSFAVRAGEVFGLLGPNGAGKSTTVKVLATLTKPDAGRAEVAGHNVVREPNAVRRAIGYVPQSSGVDRDATGRENLILQGRVQGMSGRALETRVAELLDLLGLAPSADRVVRGSTSAWGSSTGRRSSSWTSRPQASTRRLVPRCGKSSSGSPRASP